MTGFAGFIVSQCPIYIVFMQNPQESQRELLGRRMRSLRTLKRMTQQELGEKADVNYKFLGEIERGRQNPSFDVLSKIATALDVEVSELFRFDHEVWSRKEVEAQIKSILKEIPDDYLRQLLMLLRAVHPFH
jgi:transcriptional regulator with XRE-family HTH domain